MSGPAYTEVQVLAPAGWHELVAEALAVERCTGVAFGPRSLASEPAPEGRTWVRAFFEERGDERALRELLARRLAGLAAAAGAPELEGLAAVFRRLPPEDWAETWRKVWRPMRVGRVAVVSRGWPGALRPDDVRLELEPGAAFGTGRHATTRACLRGLQARMRPGASILDAGCGSGILSVAAALLGAGRVVGFDVDPTAVAHSVDLARENRALDRCTFLCGGFERIPGGGFDGVLANLYSDLVREHARDLAAALAPGGWAVVSGCRSDARDAVRTALDAAGLELQSLETRGRWDAFVLCKRRPEPCAGPPPQLRR